ncbi:MAG: hypothetical protein ACK5VI_02680, partial [Opitutia bacterium]
CKAFAWAYKNQALAWCQQEAGWLDKAADDCAAKIKAPRCWAVINGIKAATLALENPPSVTAHDMGAGYNLQTMQRKV